MAGDDQASGQRPWSERDYPGTWQEFERWFADDEACVAYLEWVRWPEGFVCPVCESTDAWHTAGGLWMCQDCGRRTSVTAGTIFHRSRLPLRTWFAAMWFVCAQKNGVSALGLQRVLGLGSYQTAWAWLHKLRRAMVRPDREPLGGTHSATHPWSRSLPMTAGCATRSLPSSCCPTSHPQRPVSIP